ncbi:MAG: hypothetical protein AB1545_13325, partial [Thermodesulfobacteriota bacterium]
REGAASQWILDPRGVGTPRSGVPTNFSPAGVERQRNTGQVEKKVRHNLLINFVFVILAFQLKLYS